MDCERRRNHTRPTGCHTKGQLECAHLVKVIKGTPTVQYTTVLTATGTQPGPSASKSLVRVLARSSCRGGRARDTPTQLEPLRWRHGRQGRTEGKDALKRIKNRRSGTGHCRFVVVRFVARHETYRHAEPTGLCSAERDCGARSRERICLQQALHGAHDAGPVYHPLPGGLPGKA